MEQAENDRQEEIVAWEGRDEMNMAEFPIACLTSRPDKTVKTLQFEDRIWDRSRGGWTARRLTISASEKYGLPTALDDEVILGLVQLTRENEFASRQVFFSRYQLIRLMGWRNEGKSYTRLETSLKRWIGVTFYYENAWWDKAKQSWVDESFHILERVSLFRRRKGAQGRDSEPALSMFCWNEAVFRSFQSGYLKSIDLELFRRLNSPVAKRLYRLLDKRFYHRSRWEFELRELACEHVGLSRGYDAAGLKRKLRPAIAELESVGYLKAMESEQRFVRIGRGRWQVRLVKRTTRRDRSERADASGGLKAALICHGVNAATAARLTADYPAEEIRKHLQALDWLLANDGGRSLSSPAGFLVQSIRDGYDIPAALAERIGRTSARGGGSGGPGLQQEDELSRRTQARKIDRYLKRLTPERRRHLEERALASAPPLLASRYKQAVSEGVQVLVDVYRRVIVQQHLSDRGKASGKRRKRRG
jgi:plasmid replication initiation protein